MTEPATALPAKSRKRFGLSLRVLMALVVLLGGVMGWLAYQARVQREAVAAIEAAGGKVYYDLEWEYNDGLRMSALFKNVVPRERRWPKWLVDRLGPDYLGHVIAVQFAPGPPSLADDKVVARIGRLGALEVLVFGETDSQDTRSQDRGGVTDAGLVHLRNLSRLRRLELGGTNIKGPGLAHLTGLRNLRNLDLGIVPITDKDAAALSSLTLLEDLKVNSEELTNDGMVHLAALTQLKNLDLHAKRLTESGFDRFKGWPKLECLFLQADGIEDYRFLSRFPGLTNLRLDLNSDHPRHGGLGLASLETLQKLQELSIYTHEYPKSLFEHIGNLKTLMKLHIYGIQDVESSEFNHFSRMKRLQKLWLRGKTIDDSVLTYLSGLTHLKLLSLTRSSITDEGLVHLAGLTELETLSLDYTKVTNAGLIHLVPLKQCKNLTVSNTRVTGDAISIFRVKQLSR